MFYFSVKHFVIISASTCIFGQITCNDGQCIPEEWACDGEKDCQDGKDEKYCGM